MYNILVADDEDIIREGIKYLFDYESLGFTIAGEAATGTDAYNNIMNMNPDVVLMDIRMPGMTGLEVISEVKKQGYNGKKNYLTGNVLSDEWYTPTNVVNFIKNNIDLGDKKIICPFDSE